MRHRRDGDAGDEVPDTVTDTVTPREEAARWVRRLGPVTERGARPLPPDRPDVLRRTVKAAGERLHTSAPAGDAAHAAEWLFDNGWLVQRSIGLVEESLPPGFLRRLPRTARRLARVEEFARHLVVRRASRVDPEELRQWVEGVEPEPEITLGELWALPAMVRWILLEDLAACAAVAGECPVPPPARPGRSLSPPEPSRVAACVQSLRALERHDWRRFVESTSRVDAVLRRDPRDAHRRSDFATRDHLRKAVEEVAHDAPSSEVEVAEAAVRLARRARDGDGDGDVEEGAAESGAEESDDPRRHVGYWLVDDGRPTLERVVGCRPGLGRLLRRRLRPMVLPAYLASLFAATVLFALLFALPARHGGPWIVAATLLLVALPASSSAVATVHWLVSRFTTPRILPKLDLGRRGEAIPERALTLAVVPAMLGDDEEIRSVVRRAESNWLGNGESLLGVALLFDPLDAEHAEEPDDLPRLRRARQEVRRLNRLHGANGEGRRDDAGPFHLLHRRREWSESEQCWMAWERKRGKLEDLGRLLLGEPSRLRVAVGDESTLRRARFVLTLDADTVLPPGSARRLVGTLAHPLNRPRFDRRGRVVRGYTVLQPRIDVAPWSVDASPFARIFSGDRGLDLYSRAVSDVYQDLFGEGIYVGKGIYDVAAFHRSLDGRVPDGALLSHDLFEGLHGRAGLVSDVILLEEHPRHPLVWMRRRHRWIRGDWQIAPWLLPRGPAAGGGRDSDPSHDPIHCLGRWWIADNLRRSLLRPALLALLLAGWIALPGSVAWWTGVAAVVLGSAFVLGTFSAAHVQIRPGHTIGTPREWNQAWIELARWGLTLAWLPEQARRDLDAIVRALWRMIVSRRRLLQWTPAYEAERQVGRGKAAGRGIAAGPLLALGMGVFLVSAFPARVGPVDLLAAAPLLLLWLATPWLVDHLGRKRPRRREAMDEESRRRLRWLARDTWSLFERVLGPDDHWLPPDHVQQAPHPRVAHRTSPTNIGLAALANLAAWDLGYLSTERLVALLENLFDTLDRLERYRGHFLNWYDTRRLVPLPPRYVSTVDSGNLACSLVALARGLEELAAPTRDADAPEGPGALRTSAARREALRRGLEDGAGALRRLLERRGWRGTHAAGLASALDDALADLRQAGESANPGDAWASCLGRLAERHLPTIESRALEVVDRAPERIDPRELAGLRHRLHGFRHQVEIVRAEWTAEPEDLARRISDLVRRADAMAEDMDFSFLYDEERHLFRIGYDVDAARLDSSWYDLLASEARAAGYFAIARGQVPVEHWIHLGRPFRSRRGRTVLLSWTGTLFEYLMPSLFLPTPAASLLDFAVDRAVDRQMAFGRRRGLPWGVSESGYHELDVSGGYRYRAFGVPELALRRDVEERVVVASYASCLAAPRRPLEVLRNVEDLTRRGAAGFHGLYEAIDFGRRPGQWRRRRENAGRGRVVRSYMAHHQAMILLALDNLLHEDAPHDGDDEGRRGVMVDRLLSDPRMSAVSFLLYENVPERVPVQSTFPTPPPSVPLRAVQPVDPGQWGWTALAERPRAHVLTNGRWSTLITDRGSGGARLRGGDRHGDLALTRWRSDATLDHHGMWIYLQDLQDLDRAGGEGATWSATARPTTPPAEGYEVILTASAAEFHRRHAGIFSRLVVSVTPRADVEVRQLLLRNDSQRRRRLGVCSFGEVSLAPQAADRRHPAYARLFVVSRYYPGERALLFRRRGDAAAYLAHGLTGGGPHGVRIAGWETDRRRFLGRRGDAARPTGLRHGPSGLSRTQGATLDPAFCLGCEVELPPNGEVELTFLTAAGAGESDALAALDSLRGAESLTWALGEAEERTATQLGELGLGGEGARHAQALLSALVFPARPLRRTGEGIPEEGEDEDDGREPRQSVLWSLGVSGDRPVLLLRVADSDHRAEILEVLRSHAWLRRRGVSADLLLLDEVAGGYEDRLHDWLQQTVATIYSEPVLGRDGGVFHVPEGRLDPASRPTLEAAATVYLDTAEGGLEPALGRLEERPVRLPPFFPLPPAGADDEPTPPLPPPEDLRLEHRRGGLAADGNSYVVRVRPGRPTPAPWCNVICNPDFGFLVSERGGGFTWSQNSGERRLSPWSNDPVLDPPGEVVYLRDEETGELWSATPAPAGGDADYQVRHAPGRTTFRHHRHGLEQRLLATVAPGAPVKILSVDLHNVWKRGRRLTMTYYVEWTLGSHRDVTAPHVVTERLEDPPALLAAERFSQDFPRRVAFVASGEPIHGFTCDRAEFLGSGGLRRPAGLQRIGLGEAAGAGLDPCAALQVHVDLAAGERRRVYFLLGDGESREEAVKLIRRWRRPGPVGGVESAAREAWSDRLGRFEVRTPDVTADALFGCWLPYQSMASRLWARSGFYQSSGAFGFRDQLQDCLAFLLTDPPIARRQILECARHQFAEGDVLHWWHPSGGGTRTRCSDDLVWLPYALAAYVEATGDDGILEESVPFLDGEPLAEDEDARYAPWPQGEEGTLYEHGRRALDRAWTRGPHGLPLIGSGDWNDSMDEIGAEGRGESVWLAWFLLATAGAWEPLCAAVEGRAAADALRERAETLRVAVEEHGWDGAWYRRAYHDDGTPVGTAEAREARIDSISQSWAVLSGAAEPDRARRAVDAACSLLVREEERLVLLLDPPFDRTAKRPGYIQDYPPGVRENGGQYTHAAVWLAWALADLGDGDRAGRLFELLNPFLRGANETEIERYRVEPYVVAADVYGAPPAVGMGGWTWYTGSAAWLWRLGTERILGIRRSGGRLVVDPCLPPHWPGYEATVRVDGLEIHVRVENPHGISRGVATARLDGRPVPEAAAPLDGEGAHELHVVLGPTPNRKS